MWFNHIYVSIVYINFKLFAEKLKNTIKTNHIESIKDANKNLETICEFYVERRMNNSIKSLITGKDINDIVWLCQN